MFCMLMRKHLLGARVTDVGQVAGDRILTIVLTAWTSWAIPWKRRSIWR